MQHFYSEIDGITTTFGNICANRDGLEKIALYFERPNKAGGFDFLETDLPTLYVRRGSGFSDIETEQLLRYANNNASLIWEIAREDA